METDRSKLRPPSPSALASPASPASTGEHQAKPSKRTKQHAKQAKGRVQQPVSKKEDKPAVKRSSEVLKTDTDETTLSTGEGAAAVGMQAVVPVGEAEGSDEAAEADRQDVRVRFHIIRNERIENVGKSQSCMVSKLRIIWKQTRKRNAKTEQRGGRR